ncbi:uncharacterized protein ACJ7VT_019960 isoform 2-T2 [Polymixia lowei]
MTSRQHVSFKMCPLRSHTRPQIVKVGRQASDGEPVPRSLETWDHHTSQLHAARRVGRPQMGSQSQEVWRPPHQSAACSKTRPQIVKVGPVPRSLETLDHHTSCMQQDFPNKRVPDKRVLPWGCCQQAEK